LRFYFLAPVFSQEKTTTNEKIQTSSTNVHLFATPICTELHLSARSEYYQQQADYKMEVELDDKKNN
jgi:hypothetical protein